MKISTSWITLFHYSNIQNEYQNHETILFHGLSRKVSRFQYLKITLKTLNKVTPVVTTRYPYSFQ
jgi:hypothetical protein